MFLSQTDVKDVQEDLQLWQFLNFGVLYIHLQPLTLTFSWLQGYLCVELRDTYLSPHSKLSQHGEPILFTAMFLKMDVFQFIVVLNFIEGCFSTRKFQSIVNSYLILNLGLVHCRKYIKA